MDRMLARFKRRFACGVKSDPQKLQNIWNISSWLEESITSTRLRDLNKSEAACYMTSSILRSAVPPSEHTCPPEYTLQRIVLHLNKWYHFPSMLQWKSWNPCGWFKIDSETSSVLKFKMLQSDVSCIDQNVTIKEFGIGGVHPYSEPS